MEFRPLPPDREPTRAALHAYAHGATALSRVHGVAHPKWWHVSLKVGPAALVSDPVPLPGGGALQVSLDLLSHAVIMRTGEREVAAFSMRDEMTGTEMGTQIIAAASELGLAGEYDTSKFEDDVSHEYDPDHARAIVDAFVTARVAFERYRADLSGPLSPIQVWPHNFDMSMEWFGSRTETYDGEELPGQLNLGLFPKDRAYFYSNPWPFDEGLIGSPLPHGAEWHTEGWKGTILHYDVLAGDPNGIDKLVEYASAVYALAAPTLTA